MSKAFRELGFKYVTLDLDGDFRSGKVWNECVDPASMRLSSEPPALKVSSDEGLPHRDEHTKAQLEPCHFTPGPGKKVFDSMPRASVSCGTGFFEFFGAHPDQRGPGASCFAPRQVRGRKEVRGAKG